MNRFFMCFLILLIAGCSKTRFFNFEAGFYRALHPKEKAIWKALSRSCVTINLGENTNISISKETGKGGGNNLSFEELKDRIEKIKDRHQITILEEKNFNPKGGLDNKIISHLKILGFKTIIIQAAHSEGILIVKVIRN